MASAETDSIINQMYALMCGAKDGVARAINNIGGFTDNTIVSAAKQFYVLIVNVKSGLMEAVKRIGGIIYNIFEMCYKLAGYLGGLATSSYKTVRWNIQLVYASRDRKYVCY